VRALALQAAATERDLQISQLNQISDLDQISHLNDPDRLGHQQDDEPDGRMPMLICDDRPEVRQELSRVLRLRSQGEVVSVDDRTDLLNTYRAISPVQVMIGIHPGSTFGIDALDLLLENHPKSQPVVYGSRRDIELLARAYARGAGGLLLWETGTLHLR
jgi:hypothetical protein